MALCPSRLYTKYSKQIKEEVGGEGDHTLARGRTYIRITGGRPYID